MITQTDIAIEIVINVETRQDQDLIDALGRLTDYIQDQVKVKAKLESFYVGIVGPVDDKLHFLLFTSSKFWLKDNQTIENLEEILTKHIRESLLDCISDYSESNSNDADFANEVRSKLLEAEFTIVRRKS